MSMSTSTSTSTTTFFKLPPELVLSLRILINSLMEMFKNIVAEDDTKYYKREDNNKNNNIGTPPPTTTTTPTTATTSPSQLSLRKWLSTVRSQQYNINHTTLLKHIDNYGVELVETTLELLRQQTRDNGSNNKDDQNHRPVDGDGGQYGDGDGYSSMRTQRKRIVKVLQHVTMSTNFFLVMEADDVPATTTTTNNNTTSSNNSGSLNALAGLSRILWRDLARFVVEEVDHLSTNTNIIGGVDKNSFIGSSSSSRKNHYNEEEKEFNDNEECQIAATDVLYRLTKHQVRTAILFHNKMEENHHHDNYIRVVNNDRRRCLSEEELSIVVITILRLLGHPTEYWTAPSQEWVTNLLRDPFYGDKLGMALRATLICLEYVPDPLPRVEQIRVGSTLEEILLSTEKKTTTTTTTTIPITTTTCTANSLSSIPYPFDMMRVEEEEQDLFADPWQSFWSSRHHYCE